MGYQEYKGNLFDSEAQTLINTVNCVGVMGKGIALEFRRRFPDMYKSYSSSCQNGLLKPGQILPYRKTTPWVLNLAVKNDWKHPSKLIWVESCLEKFRKHYKELGVTSAAFPWIGAMNGGLPWERVHLLMRQYLKGLDINIEVVEFDPDAPDPLFRKLCEKACEFSESEFAREAGITRRAAATILKQVAHAPSLTRICSTPGIGKTTVDSLYTYLSNERTNSSPVLKGIFDVD